MSGTIATEDPTIETLAVEVLNHWIERFDRSCNRFQPESEISIINSSGGGTFSVSSTLERSLVAAQRADHLTGGLCDPTVLSALESLGYDRDYELVARSFNSGTVSGPSPGARGFSVDLLHHTVTVASGVRLDLGATAKPLLADIVVAELARHGGVLVEVGGDVALRGCGPCGPWVVGLATSLAIVGDEPRVSINHGGVATSSTATRVWRSGDRVVNHVIDPRTGDCAAGTYVTATVVAPDCVTANAFATAALLWDDDAGWHIAQAGHGARLLRREGSFEYVGAWPREAAGAC